MQRKNANECAMDSSCDIRFEDHLFVLGGFSDPFVSQYVLTDVWRSAISFNHSMLLAQTCIGWDTVIIPEHFELQCWPANSTCQASAGRIAHSLAQLDSDETNANDTIIIHPHNFPVNETSACTLTRPILMSSSGRRCQTRCDSEKAH